MIDNLPIVKELRDQAARETKGDENPFYARKQRVEWRAADLIEGVYENAIVELRDYLISKGAAASVDTDTPLEHDEAPRNGSNEVSNLSAQPLHTHPTPK